MYNLDLISVLHKICKVGCTVYFLAHLTHQQWRRNLGFKRFNKLDPELLGASSGATKNFRQENNRPTSEKLTTNYKVRKCTF